jgi:hypothetical protein
MASSDWSDLDNQLAFASVAQAATTGLTPPSGGGTFTYAFNSLSGTVTGAAGKFCVLGNFHPTLSGTWIAGAVKRLAGSQNTGFSPFLFIQAPGYDVNDQAYILGLEDADPYRIVLRKGTIIDGVPAADTTGTYLRRSSQQYQISDDLWHHLALECVEQPNGECYLNVWESDLAAHAVTAPSWTAIAGMAQFIDDAAGINSGSLPLSGGGYAGFACAVAEAIGVRAAFDHIQIRRQV